MRLRYSQKSFADILHSPANPAAMTAPNPQVGQPNIFFSVQADVSGTIVKWLVDNGSQITPGQVTRVY